MNFKRKTKIFYLLVGNIGLSASAESVHHSVKRSSRRGANLIRHHPHRSSSRRNKENGNKSNLNATTTTTTINNCNTGGNNSNNNNNSGNGGGGGGGGSGGCNVSVTISNDGTSTTTTQGPIINLISSGGNIENVVQQQSQQLQHQSNRSNSFRSKKTTSNLMTDCTSITCNNGKMRKPRAVSFESSPQNIQTAGITVIATSAATTGTSLSLTKISSSSSTNPTPYHFYHSYSHDQTPVNITFMDTTPPPSDNNITPTLTLPSSQSQPTIPPSNVVHETAQETLTSSSTSHLHFKPPRV